MIIVGCNMGKTQKGMKLNDGGICIINTQENKVIAIAEERISRKKYDGGFEKSLKKYLELYKKEINDIDMFVISSCCERPIVNKKNLIQSVPEDKINIVPSHHLSHAYSAYYSSNFDEAIIMVLDNEGNIIGDEISDKFYENEMEHMSYYVANKNKIELIERDEVPIGKIGVGDAYRYFTHYIGFPSYVYAGKTMGLAPYGNSNAFNQIKIFNLENGKIKCNINSNYFKPGDELRKFFQEEYGIILPKERIPIDEITQLHSDLAYLIQKETEEILIKKVNYLVEKTGIKNLCIAGGVGLNSVVNGRIMRECNIDKIHIVPAAGDSGECLGNAFYGYYNILNNVDRLKFKNAYLGFEYSKEDLKNSLKLLKDENVTIKEFNSWKELNKIVASKLAENKIIARCCGRSEFGPRALGNRSILMDARKKENKDILNERVKFRESFRPFAPIVLNKYANEYFEIDRESKYMLLVSKVKKPDIIPAVTHVDNTARLQTLNKEDNESLYDLIEQYMQLTNVPVILNTSFNIADEPIVETYNDAIRCFISTNIDGLILENYYIEKM